MGGGGGGGGREEEGEAAFVKRLNSAMHAEKQSYWWRLF